MKHNDLKRLLKTIQFRTEKTIAYRILQNMTFGKTMTETVRRAVRVRLQAILENEESMFERWQSNVRHKLNATRQKQIEREFKKRIQAFKITIHALTPFWEREGDVPTFVIRKERKGPE